MGGVTLRTNSSHKLHAHTWIYVAWLKTRVIESGFMCLSQKIFHLHILAQHIAHALLVVLLPDEHYFTFHSFQMHSNPTNYSTIIQTSTDVIFKRRKNLRRFIECVFRSYAGINIDIHCERTSERWKHPHCTSRTCLLAPLVFEHSNLILHTEHFTERAHTHNFTRANTTASSAHFQVWTHHMWLMVK